jgi:oligosaccharide repeat unit polymerase
VLGEGGAYAWFLCFYVAFVQVGFTTNLVQALLSHDRSVDAAECGLLVTSLALFVYVALGLKSRVARGVDKSMSWTSETGLWVMAIVVIAPAWFYFLALGSIPLVDAIRSGGLGSLQDARLSRDPYVNAKQAYIPFAGLLESFRNVGVPALFAAAFLRWRQESRPRFIVLMALCALTVVAAGQRWPMQYLLLTTLVALIWIDPSSLGRSWRRICSWGVGVGVVLTVLQGRSGGGDGIVSQLWGGFTSLLYRIFVGYVYVPILSYERPSLFAEPLLGDSYLQTLKAFAPGPSVTYAVTFYNRVLGIKGGYTASPDVATEMYLNFRWWGVIIGSVVVALILIGFDNWGLRLRLGPEHLALLSMAIVSIAASTTEGLVAASLRPIFIAVPVLIALRVIPGCNRSPS